MWKPEEGDRRRRYHGFGVVGPRFDHEDEPNSDESTDDQNHQKKDLSSGGFVQPVFMGGGGHGNRMRLRGEKQFTVGVGSGVIAGRLERPWTGCWCRAVRDG